MALRIADSVIRGEIDNRLRDHVVGRIWVEGLEDPLRLNLEGNCLRDIAGHHLVFRTTGKTVPLDQAAALAIDQEGCVGDMTGSRKVKALNVSLDEFVQLRARKLDPPTCMANCLYLEWFSKRNGRVVIETVDFEIEALSDPEWSMTSEEAEAQQRANVDAMSDFLHRLDDAINASPAEWDEDDGPMDEFQWERFLRDADERTERFGEVFEKYQGHPDAEKMIAREMGWQWLDDALDADAKGIFDEAREQAMEEDDIPDLEPNPETEGIDWIRTERGGIRHPLSHRAYQFQHHLWSQARALGLVGSDDSDEDVMNMISEARMLSAKLAGALNSLGYDRLHDAGFVVAALKRALGYFDTTIAAMAVVQEKQLLDEPVIHVSRCELFEIRESILELMREFRTRS